MYIFLLQPELTPKPTSAKPTSPKPTSPKPPSPLGKHAPSETVDEKATTTIIFIIGSIAVLCMGAMATGLFILKRKYAGSYFKSTPDPDEIFLRK